MLEWFGEKRLAEIKEEQRKRLEKATRHLRNKWIAKISHKTGKDGPASSPGEPPSLRTGQLRRSAATEVVDEGDNLVGRVGTSTIYARYLEGSTTAMAARPSLEPTAQEEAQTVKEILSAPMN